MFLENHENYTTRHKTKRSINVLFIGPWALLQEDSLRYCCLLWINGFSNYDDTQTRNVASSQRLFLKNSLRTLQIFACIFQIPSIRISQVEDYKTKWTRCVVVIIINNTKNTERNSDKIRIEIASKSHRIDWSLRLWKNEVHGYSVRNKY